MFLVWLSNMFMFAETNTSINLLIKKKPISFTILQSFAVLCSAIIVVVAENQSQYQSSPCLRVWARANFRLNTSTIYALRQAYFFPGPSAPYLWLSVGGWLGSCGITIQVYHNQRGYTQMKISSTGVN